MKRGRSFLIVSVTALLLFGALAVGLMPRFARQKMLLANSQEERSRLPVVNVTPIHRSPATTQSLLPGNIEALYEVPLYARVDGYLQKLYVDIGDRVRTGQVLAEIDSPEIDQQLRQARALLAQSQAALNQVQAASVQARANLNLAKVTWERWQRLAAKGVVSRQDSDEKQAAYDSRAADVGAAEAAVEVARSSIHANEANVQRLVEMKTFDKVVAPFDGVITVRSSSPGTLVAAGGSSSARELLRMAKIDTVRIFISVPQTDAASIHPGQTAEVRVKELPDRIFHGAVTRTANALDANAHTLRTEVQVHNPDFVLLPGMYSDVTFNVSRQAPPLLIPGDALVFTAQGIQVALLTPDHKVHFQKVAVGRDYGAQIEVISGLSDGDTLIVNPSDEVREGVMVDPRWNKA